MNHIDKKLLAELKNGVNYENNLPVYTTQMMHLEYEYSVILAALHYYTLGEILTEEKDSLSEDFLSLADRLQQCVKQGFVVTQPEKNALKEAVGELDDIRNAIIHKMQILTAYTDILQIYEYVLNRLEAGILDLTEDVDTELLCDQLYRYVFKENDNMVINSKLQMITAQLPMRMTKSKFFDTVSQAFSIYNGAERVNFDEFVERIRGTVLLDRPDGFDSEYPDIYQVITELSDLDYQKLSKEEFLAAEEKLTTQAEQIHGIVTDYLMLTDVVNSVYAAVLAMPYCNVISDALSNSRDIICFVYEAVTGNGSLEQAAEKLVLLEGQQEQIMEELSDYEGAGYEIQSFLSGEGNTVNLSIDAIEYEKLRILGNMEQLHSNSVFIDLHKEVTDQTLADAEYIGQVAHTFEEDMTVLLNGVSRPVKRAYMAAVIGQLPVIFNNTQEIQEYIRYTLGSCSNASELTAVKTLLEDMMME